MSESSTSRSTHSVGPLGGTWGYRAIFETREPYSALLGYPRVSTQVSGISVGGISSAKVTPDYGLCNWHILEICTVVTMSNGAAKMQEGSPRFEISLEVLEIDS